MKQVKLILSGNISMVIPEKWDEYVEFKNFLIDNYDPDEDVILQVGRDKENCKLSDIFNL